MGARGGIIAPDEITFDYIKGRQFAPKGEAFDIAIEKWKHLATDDDAIFDKEYSFDASDISPMITYGTNPGMGIKIESKIPTVADVPDNERLGFKKALDYMGFEADNNLVGKPINYVFIGSCTNSRIEDLRLVAQMAKGRKKADNVTAWIVPGSKKVENQAIEEGLDKILASAGFELREPGCSACLGMNEDKIPSGEYCISTSNRNFEGRQGPGAKTLLASPLTAMAAALTGKITDPRDFI
jgi:3-isopropylmalate/(R)-2-methylmalate dehydratase large subunit